MPGSSPLVRGQRHCRKHCVCARRIIPARAGPTIMPYAISVISADHPRSCGANHLFLIQSLTHCGSSPLVRGQLGACDIHVRRERIIPARAGPTNAGFDVVFFGTDHPRSCGANHVLQLRRMIINGSSPLVRGQHTLSTATCTFPRIIPARAGPTVQRRNRANFPADHPRSCGANRRCRCLCQRFAGSSPLVRGQLTVSY